MNSNKRSLSFALPAIGVSALLYIAACLISSKSSPSYPLVTFGSLLVAAVLLTGFLYLIYRFIVARKADDTRKLWLTFLIGTALIIIPMFLP